MRWFRQRAANEGFSLVELLAVLTIIGILSGIAVPLYLNQKSRSALFVVQQDATNIGQEMLATLSAYSDTGTAPVVLFSAPNASNQTTATFTGFTGAKGGPVPPDALTVRLTVGDTAAGYVGANQDMSSGLGHWCIIVNGTYGTKAVFSEAGLSKSATQCKSDGTIA